MSQTLGPVLCCALCSRLPALLQRGKGLWLWGGFGPAVSPGGGGFINMHLMVNNEDDNWKP